MCFLTWKINSQLHSAAWICSPSFFFEFKKYIVLIFFFLSLIQIERFLIVRYYIQLSANQNFYWSKQNIRKFETKNKACFTFWSGPISRERAIWDLSARQSREFCTELKSTMRLCLLLLPKIKHIYVSILDILQELFFIFALNFPGFKLYYH